MDTSDKMGQNMEITKTGYTYNSNSKCNNMCDKNTVEDNAAGDAGGSDAGGTRYSRAEADGRTELLLGAEGIRALRAARVIVFGTGGVGSWCIEALARSGVGSITVVDSDTVACSNINRQLVADADTIGQVKVDVMARRIHAISPECRVHAVAGIYNAETASGFDLDSYDVVVDAIDSVEPKIHLILSATSCRHARLVSSMGAALKTDIDRIAVAEFGNVRGCPLARALRDRMKRAGVWPRRKFRCVYSPQLVANSSDAGTDDTANGRKRVNGTLVTTTAVFGLRLAQLALEKITEIPK